MLWFRAQVSTPQHASLRRRTGITPLPKGELCITVCLKQHLRAFFRRPWVFSRALGCEARRGAACTPRRKFGSRAGSVARALGGQCREIWQVITGSLSVELTPSKKMENAHVSHCCKAQQHGNNNRLKLSPVLQLQTLLCVGGSLLYMCGHDVCVYALCVHVHRVRVRVCMGSSMTHYSTRLLRLGKDAFSDTCTVNMFSPSCTYPNGAHISVH